MVSGTLGLGVLYTLFNYIFINFEKGIKEEKKKEFGKKLFEFVNKPLLSTFGSYVIELSNILFTKTHFSLKCFWRSLVASSLFVLFLHLCFFFFNTEIFSNPNIWYWLPFIPSFLLTFILYNSFDFFLLWKTRKLLQLITSKKRFNILFVGFIDLVVTFVFAIGKLFLIKLILEQTLKLDWSYFTDYVLQVNYPPAPESSHNDARVIPGLFFYSSFFYSIFLWLYFISIFLIRKMQFLGRLKTWFQKNLDIENRPVEFLKIIFGVLLLFLGVGVWVIIRI